MTTEFGSWNLLGLEPAQLDYQTARVTFVPVPYDGTTSFEPGARRGPRALVDASAQVELFDVELGREIVDVGLSILPPLTPCADGPESMVRAVEHACTGPVSDGKFVFTLGGEHSVSVGAARAVVRRFPGVSFLQIDAHLDLRDSYEGTRYSHASAARRLLELGPLAQVGVRAACPEELAVIREQDLSPIWAHEVAAQPREAWIARAIGELGEQVYVTLDVDGIDPSVIPGTGTPVPGGLSWYDTLALLKAVGEQRHVVAADLVELSPGAGDHRSAYAAALLMYKMIGYFVH